MNLALGFPLNFLLSRLVEINWGKFWGTPKGVGNGGSCFFLLVNVGVAFSVLFDEKDIFSFFFFGDSYCTI